MRGVSETHTRCWIALFLSVFLTAAAGYQALADEEGPTRVLRVAFPQVRGMTETDSDGRRHGVVVDYLNEIAKYTGWKYEYIDTSSETMVDEFLDGRYDLMGGTYYSPGFEEYFAYPDINTGYSKSVILARREDQRIRSYDLESMNGKTIGVYERAAENIRRLKEFLLINGVECTFKSFTYEDISSDGNLYQYLESGEVDMLLGNSFENDDSFRVVTSFDAQPYYIVTNLGNQEVLDGLNMALEYIADSDPDFVTKCYAANFPDQKAVDLLLNSQELDYISQKDTVMVAVTENWHPLFCLNSEGGYHNGLVPDILDKITEFSGLKFSYLYADTYLDAIGLVQDGKADMLGFYLGAEEEAHAQGLALSSTYAGINSIVVRNKGSNYPDDGLVGAIIDGRAMPASVAASEVQVYPSITDALSAVNAGKADFVYGLSARMEQDIQQFHFSNLVPVTLVNDRNHVSFALKRPVEPELFTVLNKAINSLSSEEKTEVVNRNLISIGLNKFSLRGFIYANPFTFIGVVTLFLMAAVFIVLWIARLRMRAAVMRSNLEKAEAESRAKGEFLSRMSHEIRTPMNAIIGLTDLTSMIKDVPDDIKENLTKIRSSSHYLLDLINDILDMSRIDRGMLSVASEPFSLESVIVGLQTMMGAEARRRELSYTLEKKIGHENLIGDAIRLRQVLTNLLSNAFKFTPSGGKVLLRVEEVESSEKDATFTFRVIDSGVGILPEDQKRIFESFEQLGNNSSKSQGTGLGLPISRNIVRLMGGDLRLCSEPGKGCEFYFTVTFLLGEAGRECETAKPSEESDMLKGIRILLAEDNDLNAEIAGKLLEFQGAGVLRVEDGKKAVERFEKSAQGEFQIILMDIQMPEMNGLDAARAIRLLEHPDAASVPIVAMTANSFQEDVDAAAAAGMNGFIPKPLDASTLYLRLRDILKGA